MSAPVVEVVSGGALAGVEAWAECSHCFAIRPASKHRPWGQLRCEHCGASRKHSQAWPALWAAETAWLERLFTSAGFELYGDALPPMDGGLPTAVKVSCLRVSGDKVGPLAAVRVTLNDDLTPWGLPRALRTAWDSLSFASKWEPSYLWGDGDAVTYRFWGKPGDVDARLRHNWWNRS